MSRLLQLQAAIIESLKTLAPNMDVAGHLGRFDEGELQAFMIKAPAARVAVLGLDQLEPDAGQDLLNAVARLGIYVVTKDGPRKDDRVGQALGLVETVVLHCDRQRWGLGIFAKPAKVAGAQLIYSQPIRTAGVALWAIDLRQPVQLSKAEAEIGQLETAFGGLAPNIGAGHQQDYVRLAATPETGEIDV